MHFKELPLLLKLIAIAAGIFFAVYCIPANVTTGETVIDLIKKDSSK